ncbi:hypothetical protein ES705_40109 [subsurface metagenome]
MAKRKKPLICKYCKKKFFHSKDKPCPLSRLSKHQWKQHKSIRTKTHKIALKNRKSNVTKVTKLDKEFMAIDDILLSDLIDRRGYSRTSYDSVHEQLGGLIIEALLPIAVESIARAIKKKKTRK